MSFRTTILLTPLLALGLGAPASAEGTGQIALTIAGEDLVLPLRGGQSDWSGSANWPSISLSARAFNEDGEDPIVVNLSFDAANWAPSLPELRLTRYEDSQVTETLFSGEDEDDGALSVTLDSHDLQGTTLTLTGRFQGTMGPSENYGRDIDLSKGQPVEGTFEVTVEELD